jgi:hypothetical protein
MSYIMACIHLPLEVFPDGSYKPMNDIANIIFEKCDELPKTSNLPSINLDEIFKNLCKKQAPTPEPFVCDGAPPPALASEGSDVNLRFPPTRVHSKNITFRNSRPKSNFTRRLYG